MAIIFIFDKIVVMKKINLYILGLIFLLAIVFRFINFRESIYFGYDEARDAYISTEIYTKGDFKIMGPPATGNIGLFHGSLYWYMLGPIYLLSQGDPATVSAVFRIINALGVFVVFYIGSNLFAPGIGILSALFYACSYEESQYAMYVGNPGWGVITTLGIFAGITWLIKSKKNKHWALYLMFGSASLATQLNIIFFYFYFVIILLLILFRKSVKTIKVKHWIGSLFLSICILSTYLLTEFKYNFRTIKTAIKLVSEGFGVMSPGQSKYLLYWDKYITMYKDNVFPLVSTSVVVILAVGISLYILFKSAKKIEFRILAVWIFAWVILMMFGGHTSYYTNAGLGIGVIMAFSIILKNISRDNIFIITMVSLLVIAGNLLVINKQSVNSLISGIKPQPMVKLADEYRIIDKMYQYSKGQGFTVRVTGIPYKVQTVWAYLFNNYAKRKYGYLPYYETGNTLGFPGMLPTPINGTTCNRFLVREPMTGLPVYLVDLDEKEENIFSKITKREDIGDYSFESRIALDPKCHGIKP
jgi:hypothetical protein